MIQYKRTISVIDDDDDDDDYIYIYIWVYIMYTYILYTYTELYRNTQFCSFFTCIGNAKKAVSGPTLALSTSTS